MTDFAGMPSYFWLVSPRLKRSGRGEVPYTSAALRQDLLRVRNAWEESQSRRDRDAIYCYLSEVFNLVAWWAAEGRAVERAQKALRLNNIRPSDHDEPPLLVALLIGQRLTSAPAPNGHGFCGTHWNASLIPSCWINSLSARAVSTVAPSNLPCAVGDIAI